MTDQWDELQAEFNRVTKAALAADLTALESNIEFHFQGRGGRIACVSGWSRDGYLCLSVNQEDLTLHGFTEAINGEFPDAAHIDVRGEDGWWIANGKLEANMTWQLDDSGGNFWMIRTAAGDLVATILHCDPATAQLLASAQEMQEALEAVSHPLLGAIPRACERCKRHCQRALRLAAGGTKEEKR